MSERRTENNHPPTKTQTQQLAELLDAEDTGILGLGLILSGAVFMSQLDSIEPTVSAGVIGIVLLAAGVGLFGNAVIKQHGETHE